MKRGLLLISCLAVILVVSSVVSAEEGPIFTPRGVETGPLPEKFNEAPMLAELVAAGELPALEERLPEDVMVIEPVEETGQYGGTLYLARVYLGYWGDGISLLGLDNLFRIDYDLSTIVPGVAKAYELSEDKKTLTIHLRKGMKWSDGEPFTADDIMFWYEDIILNEDLTPVLPKQWSPGDEPMEVKKIDDYTVSLHFAEPYAAILLQLAHWMYGIEPKHYLKQFHPKYAPIEELEEMAKDAGLDYWYQLFENKRRSWCGQPLENPDLPTVLPYYLAKYGTDISTFERNPYYWKVDTAGNQLPYIDKILIKKVENVEMYNAKIVSGELDCAGFNTSVLNYPLYKENAEQGDYRVLLWSSGKGSEVVYQVNMTYEEDTVLRDIFRDLRFRQALSLAIDREEINDVIFFGLGVPRQMTFIDGSKYIEPEFATAYAEHDPDKANALLDEMGLKWDENREYRLRPDGKKLGWTFNFFQSETPKREVSELVVEYWGRVGIDVKLKEGTRTLVGTQYRANLSPMALWHGDASVDCFGPLDRRWFVPGVGDDRDWCPLWAQWYETGGAEGEEPPDDIKQLFEWWEKWQETLDVEWGKNILRSQAENLWTIGVVGMAPQPIIAKNNLRNIPEKGAWVWDELWFYPYHPEQFFLKQE